jgi:hypothetical protein
MTLLAMVAQLIHAMEGPVTVDHKALELGWAVLLHVASVIASTAKGVSAAETATVMLFWHGWSHNDVGHWKGDSGLLRSKIGGERWLRRRQALHDGWQESKLVGACFERIPSRSDGDIGVKVVEVVESIEIVEGVDAKGDLRICVRQHCWVWDETVIPVRHSHSHSVNFWGCNGVLTESIALQRINVFIVLRERSRSRLIGKGVVVQARCVVAGRAFRSGQDPGVRV